VCQGLARGGRLGGSLAGGGEVGKLSTGLCGLVLDVLGDGAWDNSMLSVFAGSREDEESRVPLAIWS
jgi:hypothetical protein